MDKMNVDKFKKSNKNAFRIVLNTLPTIFSMLLLVSIITNTVPQSFYKSLFNGNTWYDLVIGDVLGSLLIGHPITGYIIGNELSNNGVSLIAITVFLVAWVTVGVVQSPAEAVFLGKRFALFRNISAFLLAIVVAIITVVIVANF